MQLYLDFPIRENYFSEDFYISSANKKALETVQQWPNWGEGSFSKIRLLYGEHGSGKTHLAYIWKNMSNAKLLNENNIRDLYFKEKALVLENIEQVEQEALFHLINVTQEKGQFLLLTSGVSPGKLKILLPDLRSRILAITSIAIDSPDSDLLKAVLLKQLSDRALVMNIAAIDYIIPRIDRSFVKLISLVNKLEAYSKMSKRPITIPLIKEVL